MRKKSRLTVPTLPEFTEMVGHEDLLVIVMRAHLALNAAAARAIIRNLPVPHEEPVLRMPFLLKTDLLIALEIVPVVARGPFVALNRLRNVLAHDLASETQQPMIDFLNAMPPFESAFYPDLADHQEALLDRLRLALRMLFAALLKREHQIELQKLELAAEHAELRESLRPARERPGGFRPDPEGNARVQQRVQQLKRERGISDDPLGIRSPPVDKSPAQDSESVQE